MPRILFVIGLDVLETGSNSVGLALDLLVVLLPQLSKCVRL